MHHYVVWDNEYVRWYITSRKGNKDSGYCPLSYYTEQRIKDWVVEIIGNIKNMPNFLEEEHQKVIKELNKNK